MHGCTWVGALLAACSLVACKDAIAGGQTGDPGVTDDTEITPGGKDYVSLDPSAGQPPGPPPGTGPCNSVPVTYAISEAAGAALAMLDASRSLYLDRGSGRIVDLSELDAPRLRARLDAGAIRESFALAAERALLVVQRQEAPFGHATEQAARLGDDRVLLVDLHDPDAPAVLADQAIPGDVALATTVERADSVRLYVVGEELTKDCRPPVKRTTLHAFDVDASDLEPAGTLDLGHSVRAVAMRDGQLLVLENANRPEASAALIASVISLDDALTRSAPAPALEAAGWPPQIWVEHQGSTWTVLTSTANGPHVVQYDASDTSSLAQTADCALPQTGELAGLWVLGLHASVTTWPNQDGNRLFAVDLASCEVEERQDVWLARVPDSDALVELDSSSPQALEARVITSDGAEPVAVAQVALDGDGPAMPWASSVLASAAALQSASEPHLLAVPLQGAGGSALQLFSVSASGLHAQQRLAPGMTLAASTAQGVAIMNVGDHAVLSTFTLAGDRPAPLASLELQPRFVRGYALAGQHWARLRKPSATGVKSAEDLTEDEILKPDPSALAALEVIAQGGDPELAPALARVELNPYAQLVRLGSLFAAITNDEHSAPGITRIELLDFTDPLAPRARGTFESDALWVQDNSGMRRGPAIECLDCDRGGDGPIGLATTHSLVLRGYRWIAESDSTGHSAFAFEVVDLTDPDHPELGTTITMPDEDHAIGAVAIGDDVYYRYLRPVAGEPGRARFYVQRIGLADPSSPEQPRPVLVPGDAVAIADQHQLYTVELSRRADDVRSVLNRVSVSAGIARIEQSHELGSLRPLAVSIDGDRVLVDLGAEGVPVQLPVDGVPTSVDPPVRLLVLDGRTLEPIAEGDVAFGAMRLGAADGHVGYATWSGAMIVDADAPDDPARRQYLPGSGFPANDGQLLFSDDRALLVEPTGGRLREIAFDHDEAQP